MKTVAIILGIIFAVLAVLAATGAIHFAGGRAVGLDGARHLKHTILYAVIAVLCFLWARMSAAAPSTTRTR